MACVAQWGAELSLFVEVAGVNPYPLEVTLQN